MIFLFNIKKYKNKVVNLTASHFELVFGFSKLVIAACEGLELWKI